MDIAEINKVLSNQTRLDILMWLKEPEKNFPPQESVGHFGYGVCGQSIQERTTLSQSTISSYLADLRRVQLLEVTRKGKWTYFRRNERQISQYLALLNAQIN